MSENEVESGFNDSREVDKKSNYFKPWKSIKYLFEDPVTIKIPDEETETADDYRGFHSLNWDTCIGCRMCSRVCPARAIEMTNIEGEEKLHPKIDYGRCTFCQFCVDVCPTNALGTIENHILTIDWDEENLELFDWVPVPEEKLEGIDDDYHPIKEISKFDDGRVKYTFRNGEEFEFKILNYDSDNEE